MLERASGRPSADEAWALALETFDEAATVCLTDEILLAAVAASPVWESGDRVGARMAFKAAYERVLNERRLQGQRPRLAALARLGFGPSGTGRAGGPGGWALVPGAGATLSAPHRARRTDGACPAAQRPGAGIAAGRGGAATTASARTA